MVTNSEMIEFTFPGEQRQWPQVINAEVSDWHCQLELAITANITWFDGHFPDSPILPGVVQVHWAQFFTRQWLPTIAIEGVKNLKFNNMILPESTVCLQMNFDADKQRVKFSFTRSGQICSSGVIQGRAK